MRQATAVEEPVRVRAWLPLLALVVLGASVYANGLAGPFVFDDIPQILQSGDVATVWPGWAAVLGRQRTLTILTFAWNHALGGFEPLGYHLVNVSIHVLAGLCLFGIVRRTLGLERVDPRYRASAVPLAWIAAALWIVHPLQTESVTYVVQRSEALMGLFYLATLYCVVRAAGGARPLAWQGTAALACALGMGSKPVMITAPLVVLVFDRIFLAENWATLVRRRGGMYVGLALGWLVIAASGLVGSLVDESVVEQSAAGFGMKDVTAGGYLLTQPRVLLHYLRLALWPQPLVLDYGWPFEPSLLRALPAALVILSGVCATVLGLLRRSAFGFLGAWFFLVLAPTSSFVPLGDAAFEHRMYLPLAAVLVLVVMSAHALALEGNERGLWSRSAARRTSLVAAGLALLALGLRTRARNDDYRDAVTLWESTVRHAPGNGRAHNLLAQVLAESGRFDEAIEELRRGRAALQERGAERSDRVYRALTVNLASSLIRTGRQGEAVELLRESLGEDPGDVGMQRQLGLALEGVGQHEEALQAYRRAIALAPGDPVSHRELALLLRKGGDREGALAALEEACRVARDDVETILFAARQFSELADPEAAERVLRAALAQRPDDPRLAEALRRLRRP